MKNQRQFAAMMLCMAAMSEDHMKGVYGGSTKFGDGMSIPKKKRGKKPYQRKKGKK